MNAPHRQTPRDPDDWFEEPEPLPRRRAGRAPVPVDPDAQTREQSGEQADDWLAPEPSTRRQQWGQTAPIANRRLLIALGIALALLLVGLALAGVFSGGGNKSAQSRTTQTAPTTAQSPTPTLLVPTATLKLGDHGKDVKELQRVLGSLGFTVGMVDGVFGPSTERAVIAFQSAHKLSPDGVFGPATRAALLNALHPG